MNDKGLWGWEFGLRNGYMHGVWELDRGQKACASLKAWSAPLGNPQCVGQPQGVCEGGPQGVGGKMSGLGDRLGLPKSALAPLPNLLPEMPVQMAICQGGGKGGCRLKFGAEAWQGENQCWMFYYDITIWEQKTPAQ